MIDEPLAAQLRASLAPISKHMFRDLLRESDVLLAPIVEGVRQDDFHQLERTLLELAQQYASSDRPTQLRIRRLVIEAKDHAKLTAHNPKVDPAKQHTKIEMVLWMMTWLENPSIFELWVPLRKAQLAATPPTLP